MDGCRADSAPWGRMRANHPSLNVLHCGVMLKGLWLLPGHHETPPEAHTNILERFPESFPRAQGNVIPPTDKKAEEVSHTGAFQFLSFFFHIT